MERGYVANMANGHKCRKPMGPPCGMMDGSQRWIIVQYRWSEWLVNMQIQTRGNSHGGTQIEVDFKKWLGK